MPCHKNKPHDTVVEMRLQLQFHSAVILITLSRFLGAIGIAIHHLKSPDMITAEDVLKLEWLKRRTAKVLTDVPDEI